MSDETPRLRLPQLVSQQEMTNVTWNEALAQLDAIADLVLLGQYVNSPPSNPKDGDAYLIGSTPTGAWTGYAYKIASCLDGSWRFYTPFNGLRAFVVPTNAFIVYVNAAWLDWNSLISANEVALASAATTDLGAASGLFVQINGTTAITSFGTGANKLRFVRFAQSLTLAHSASLILLGGVSRSTAAGDVGLYASDASGVWRERAYFRAASNPGDAATRSGSETLSNKTLAAPVIDGVIGSSLHGTSGPIAKQQTVSLHRFTNSGIWIVTAKTSNGDLNWNICAFVTVRYGVITSIVTFTAQLLALAANAADNQTLDITNASTGYDNIGVTWNALQLA